MSGYADWIRDKRVQQISTAGGLPHSRHRHDPSGEYWPAPFNRRRIIDLAIRDAGFLANWIADPSTPPENRRLFEARFPQATINRDRARLLLARLPPEWTGPAQATMI
jgi:hypothetical protein